MILVVKFCIISFFTKKVGFIHKINQSPIIYDRCSEIFKQAIALVLTYIHVALDAIKTFVSQLNCQRKVKLSEIQVSVLLERDLAPLNLETPVEQPELKIEARPVPQPNSSFTPKAMVVKAKHAWQLEIFKRWTMPGKQQWEMFKPSKSHYDWWAFPVRERSFGQGDAYALLLPQDVQGLKADKEFMENFRLGVKLVVESWGWDLENNKAIDVKDKTTQRWEGYGVRLGKMANSLRLFEEIELYHKLQVFFEAVCRPSHDSRALQLDQWVIDACSVKLCKSSLLPLIIDEFIKMISSHCLVAYISQPRRHSVIPS